MITVLDVYNYMNRFAPFENAMSWDNVGLLVGDENALVTGCLLCLDVTKDAIEFALEHGANLIVTHHPVIFGGVNSVKSDSVIYQLIKNDISVISSHTNLDLAEDGVNYALADALKLTNQRPLENAGGLGRVGDLEEEMSPLEFATFMKKNLPTEKVHYTNYDKKIKTVAVVGGEGSDYAFVCPEAQAYVSGEIKHHIFVEAQNREKQIFAVGHYHSEVCVLGTLLKMFVNEFSEFKTQTHLNIITRCV